MRFPNSSFIMSLISSDFALSHIYDMQGRLLLEANPNNVFLIVFHLGKQQRTSLICTFHNRNEKSRKSSTTNMFRISLKSKKLLTKGNNYTLRRFHSFRTCRRIHRQRLRCMHKALCNHDCGGC